MRQMARGKERPRGQDQHLVQGADAGAGCLQARKVNGGAGSYLAPAAVAARARTAPKPRRTGRCGNSGCRLRGALPQSLRVWGPSREAGKQGPPPFPAEECATASGWKQRMRALKARSRLAWGWWGVVMVDRAAARRPGTERIAGSSPGRAWCGGWTRGRENQGGWANGRPGAGMRVEDAGPEGNVGRVPTSRLQQPQCALVQRRGFAVLAIAEVLVAGSAELFHGIRDFGGHLGWAGKQGATHFPAKWCATASTRKLGLRAFKAHCGPALRGGARRGGARRGGAKRPEEWAQALSSVRPLFLVQGRGQGRAELRGSEAGALRNKAFGVSSVWNSWSTSLKMVAGTPVLKRQLNHRRRQTIFPPLDLGSN